MSINQASVGYLNAEQIRTGHVIQSIWGSTATLEVDYVIRRYNRREGTRHCEVVEYAGTMTKPDGTPEYVTAGWTQPVGGRVIVLADLRGLGWTFGQLYSGPIDDEVLVTTPE